MNAWYLVAGVALLLANGFFVGAEFALTAARRTRIERLAEQGDPRGKSALAAIKELSLVLAGAQLGITMASLGLGFVAEPAVAAVIENVLEGVADLPSGLLHSISFVVALTIVVFFHMVIGEMAPKNIAIAEPERSALWIALPFRAYMVVVKPVVHALNGLANLGLKAIGVEPQDELRASHSADELRRMIDESARGGEMDRFEHRLLSGALDIRDLDAAAAMVPRTEMTAAPVTITAAELERMVVDTGHSRIPLFGKDLDHILGFVHAKDLLKVPLEDRDEPVPRRYVRPMLIVPESRKLREMLGDMRRERKHVALVIDEHGGTAGVVSIEDLVEELVGEIRDEHDVFEQDIQTIGEGRFLVPGSLRVHEAADRIGLELPEGEYETVAGFLMDRLGRIPRRRDSVEHDGWRLWVRSMRRRRVVQVLVERTGAPVQ